MYLFIFEDGTVRTSPSYTQDDLDAVDGGYLTLIDISGDDALDYHQGEWTPVEKLN